MTTTPSSLRPDSVQAFDQGRAVAARAAGGVNASGFRYTMEAQIADHAYAQNLFLMAIHLELRHGHDQQAQLADALRELSAAVQELRAQLAER